MAEIYEIAFLDVMDPEVRAVIAAEVQEPYRIHFAQTNETAERETLVKNADFIVAGYTPVPAGLMAKAPRLRLIQKWGIGYDKIDLEAARRQGVGVTITFGNNAGPVAEFAIAMMLAVYRKLPLIDRKLREGESLKSRMRAVCYQIGGKTVGLVGFGNIGRMVAHRLRGFDVKILYADPRRAERVTETALGARRVSLAELLQASDIVSVHAPLTAETRDLIGAAELATMKPKAILINTARGGIVNEAALYDTLAAGRIAGAGLDAFEVEPPPASHPLLSLDNAVVSPHCGGSTFDNVAIVARHCMDNIMAVVEGSALAPDDVIVAPDLSRSR